MMYYLAFGLTMITPLFLLIFGVKWKIKTPKNRSSIFSYHTELSVKNDDTWAFAHYHISKLWIRIGIITAIGTLVLMIYLKDNYSAMILWILVGQMLFLCATILFVDSLMKAVFDEAGNRTI